MKRTILLYSSFLLLLLLTSASADTSLTISWSVQDSDIRPGGSTTVILTLANPSSTDDIGSIVLSLSPGPGLAISSTYFEFDSLSRGASQQTSIYVKANSNAVSADSYVKITASYSSGTTKSSTVNVPVNIRSIPILQVSDVTYDKENIGSGSRVELSFNLANNGDGPAKDITAVLNQTQGKVVATDSEYYISSLNKGEKAAIGYMLTISPDISSGTYYVPIQLTYYDELKDKTYIDTKNIGLVVSGDYNFAILAESQSVIAPGKEGTVSLQVVNVGNQEAMYLIIKSLTSGVLTQITPAEVYVGNLEPDDYDIQEFEIRVSDSAAPGNYPIGLKLVYKDSYDKSYNQTYYADVKVSSASEYATANKAKPSSLTVAIIILIVGTALFFGYRHLKKKKGR